MLHYVKNIGIEKNCPEGFKEIIFGAGCFWGVEKKFWDVAGVFVTSVGYSGGDIENPTYKQVCYENTNHVEVVRIFYDPKETNLNKLLKIFWECHDPTQGMRQGYDVGTQYRSGIYITNEVQMKQARETKDAYGSILVKNGFKSITTDIKEINNFFFAEEYHQQYLAKNPGGYCGHGGCGIKLNLD